MMSKESAGGSEMCSQHQETRPDDMGKYSTFKDKDKETVHSLLFDALRVVPFDPVKELVVQLLEVGVPVAIKDEAGSTPLAVAVKQKCPLDVINSLMVCTKLESLLQSQNKHKLTALHEAALVNNYESLQVMINKLQDNHIDIDATARKEQIRSFHCGGLDKTSSSYIIINKKNKEGWTALHYAADRGHVDVLHVLLMTEQCNVTVCNQNKQTAFHLAAKGGHLLCLQLLFAAVECRGLLESLPLSDKNEWNLACHASAHLKGDIKVMEWLLRNMPGHADINHSAKKGYTPLLLACEYQNIEIVKLLLECDQISELLTTTTDGKTALHLAAIHDSDEIARLLLEKDFPIDETDENGETPLHIAYKKGSHKVLDLLINEANRTIKNKEGKLPEDVKHTDLKIPIEIKKRGDEAVKGFIAALRKGKKKMPRCKLVILGEAGVGKTNLLNLLTGERFVPTHEKTEGVEISLVTTFDIDTKTWKKSAGGRVGDGEYRRIAATEIASHLRKVSSKADNIKDAVPSRYTHLYEVFNSVMRKYREHLKYSKAKRASSHESSHTAKRFRYKDDCTMAMKLSEQPPMHVQETQLLTAVPGAKSAKKKDFIHSTHQQFAHEQSQGGVGAAAKVSSMQPPSRSSSSSSSTEEMDTGTDEPQPSPDSTDIPSLGTHDQLYTVILRDASKLTSLGSLTLHLKLTSFDFAGQDHYKSMHPCFMTSRAIYIVTFNVRDLLPEAKCKYKCIDEINYWANSIRVHTNIDPEVILVGTHRGPYYGAYGFDVLTADEEEYINEELIKHLKNRSVFSFFKKNRIMALVESSIDNNVDDSGVKVVREKLLKLGEAHPGNKEELPLSYIRLESKIFDKRSDSKLFLIPLEEVEQWATDCDIEDVEVALDFFHDIGIIVNPCCLPTLFLSKEDVQPLQGIVLIKPQWLADVMKELMKIDRGDEKFDNVGRETRKAIDCLIETGKADKEHVLFPLWEEHHNGSEELFEQICLLLEAYGVIIPIKQSQCYYISCKLPKIISTPRITDNCHNFRVDFKDGFFPPFILHQLMFKMYQDHNPSKYEFGDKECYMEYIKDCQWWLRQNSYNDAIDVTIRARQHVRTILPAMQLLHGMLQKILKAEELNGVSYDLGPFAICSQCKKEQLFCYIAYENKRQGDDDDDAKGQEQKNKCFQCRNCQNEVIIKCNSETDKIIKSQNYKYGKSLEEFKKDLNYDGLDGELRSHFQEQFLFDLREDATIDVIGASDNKIFQWWYRQNRGDPWPLIVTHLSSYDNSTKEFEIDKIKYNFLDLCDHCI